MFMGFSLLSPLEFFVNPKNVDGRNNKITTSRGIMKIFAIIDGETTLLTGILLYYEKEGTCVIELPEYLDEWTAPLLFTSYVKKKNIYDSTGY